MLLLLMMLFSGQVHALEAQWLGVAGVALTDGESTLLFDPVITKPELKHWLTGAEFKSNQNLVKRKLTEWNIQKAQAVFASHTHFDHASDIGTVAHVTGARVFGGESLKRVATYQNPFVSFVMVKDRESVQIGSFRVTSLHRQHAPILQAIDWRFLPGPVPATFAGGFYDYHEGDTWGFYIEHPHGNVLVDQGSHFFEPYRAYAGKIRAYFMGVANKVSVQDLVEVNMKTIAAPLVVPLHFDFFMLQSLEEKAMPGVDLEAIKNHAQQKLPATRFLVPQIGQRFKI